MAIRYSAWKPRYIELYSNKPPTMAPIRFIAMIPEMWRSAESRVENTIPENSSGTLSSAAVSSRPTGVEATRGPCGEPAGGERRQQEDVSELRALYAEPLHQAIAEKCHDQNTGKHDADHLPGVAERQSHFGNAFGFD